MHGIVCLITLWCYLLYHSIVSLDERGITSVGNMPDANRQFQWVFDMTTTILCKFGERSTPRKRETRTVTPCFRYQVGFHGAFAGVEPPPLLQLTKLVTGQFGYMMYQEYVTCDCILTNHRRLGKVEIWRLLYYKQRY